MRRSICGIGLGLGLVGAVGGQAYAQQPRTTERPPSAGVERTYHDYSAEGDASSLELNPALLSATPLLDLTFRGYTSTSTFTRGSGYGVFTAFNLQELNLGFGLATGFGVQVVRPGLADDVFDFAEARNPPTTKISWGLSSGLGRYGSFGFAVHGIRSQGNWLHTDLDIGVMSRVFNYGSIGVMARLSPVELQHRSLPAEVSLIAEAAVRPLGTHHLELAAGLRAQLFAADPGESLRSVGTRGLLPRGRVAVRYQGIAVKAELEQVQTTVLDPATFQPLRGQKALRGAVGLEGSWDYFTAGAGLHAGVSDAVDGASYMLRLHTERRGRVVWSRPVDAEQLDMSQVDDARALVEMLQRIERARKAGPRAVVVVDARNVEAGWATLHELRSALIRVRNAGGHVYAYIEDASTREYYLASVAEKVLIHHAGALHTVGLATRRLYYRSALAKLGIQAEVFRFAEYKSAGDQWVFDGPTEADAEQTKEILADHYGQIVYDIARARKKSLDDVRKLVDVAPIGAEQARKLGFVDEIVYRDEITSTIGEDLQANVKWRRFSPVSPQNTTWSDAPYVAVVVIDGLIVSGQSRGFRLLNLIFSGDETIADTFRRLRGDPACKAIVVRIDSPGGGLMPSDVIRREVELTQQAHDRAPKHSPAVIVSMGDVAASGGYWIATGATTILADPMTITGSIGIITTHFDASQLLGKLGISTATFKEGEHAELGLSPLKRYLGPLDDEKRARIMAELKRGYDLFLKRVADARKISIERAHELGRGRVYTGKDALQLGLVDAIGGIQDAIDLARRRSSVPGFRELQIRVVPDRPTLLDLVLEALNLPFGRQPDRPGIGNRTPRRRARAHHRDGRVELPVPALERTLSRLPLSLIFMPVDRSQALMPYVLDVE